MCVEFGWHHHRHLNGQSCCILDLMQADALRRGILGESKDVFAAAYCDRWEPL
jgi:hypothetical protein